MSEVRKEVLDYIDAIPDSKLRALKPLLTLLVDDSFVIETDLTDEEREINAKGLEDYKANKDKYVSLRDIDRG